MTTHLPVRRHPFGETGFSVSPLGFGCSSIASLGTRHSPAEVRATLIEARDAGINFFDTADVYGQGDSERLLGHLFGDDSHLVIATKVGMHLSQSQALVRMIKPLLQPILRHSRSGRARTLQMRRAAERTCFEPAYLRGRVEASLRRLRRERLDLLLLHSPPVELARHDEVRALLAQLQAAGLLKDFGVSVAVAGDAIAFADWPGLRCLQLPLSPVIDDRGAHLPTDTSEVLRELARRNIAVVAREVFGGGRLALSADSRVKALRCVLHAPSVQVALAGMGSRRHLRDNLADLDHALAQPGEAT